MSRVCIVIPTYNEARNLPKLVETLEEELQKEDFKIIIVDDNSPDGTADIAEKLNWRYGNIIVRRRPNKLGIGTAIRDGLEVALPFLKSGHIVTMDADLSHDPKEVQNLLSEAENIDLVQGSRYVKGGRIIGWNFYRRTISYVANNLCRLLLKTGLHEHTAYFRVYSSKCAEALVRNVDRNGYDWAIASTLVAKDYGFRIKEVPVTFIDRFSGKSKLKISDILMWFSYVLRTFLKRSVFKVFRKLGIVQKT